MTSHDAGTVLVEIDGLSKAYGGLRPLRVAALTVRTGERITLVGPDLAAAEMLVTLVTGASVPDTGTVRIFGRSTADIDTTDAWLALLDRVGMISDRAVLVEQLSIAQNVAMPLTLTLHPIPPDVARRIHALIQEVGLGDVDPATLIAAAGPAVRARVRVARALAHDPELVLVEHPTASIPPADVDAFAADLSRVVQAREVAVVAISMDPRFVSRFDAVALRVEAASGRVRKPSFWEKMSSSRAVD